MTSGRSLARDPHSPQRCPCQRTVQCAAPIYDMQRRWTASVRQPPRSCLVDRADVRVFDISLVDHHSLDHDNGHQRVQLLRSAFIECARTGLVVPSRTCQVDGHRTFAATAIYCCVALVAALASQTARVLQSDDEIGHVRALLSRGAPSRYSPLTYAPSRESAAISSGCFFVTSVWTTCTILPVTARLQTAQSVLMCDDSSRRNEAIRTPRSHAHYLAHRTAQMTHRRVAEAWCAIERHR